MRSLLTGRRALLKTQVARRATARTGRFGYRAAAGRGRG
jgi:hypothetical protein